MSGALPQNYAVIHTQPFQNSPIGYRLLNTSVCESLDWSSESFASLRSIQLSHDQHKHISEREQLASFSLHWLVNGVVSCTVLTVFRSANYSSTSWFFYYQVASSSEWDSVRSSANWGEIKKSFFLGSRLIMNTIWHFLSQLKSIPHLSIKSLKVFTNPLS